MKKQIERPEPQKYIRAWLTQKQYDRVKKASRRCGVTVTDMIKQSLESCYEVKF
jgi:hypothetical protein